MDKKIMSCPSCSNEVAKSAVFCPHCRSKLRISIVEKALVLFFACWTVLFALAVIGKLILN